MDDESEASVQMYNMATCCRKVTLPTSRIQMLHFARIVNLNLGLQTFLLGR